MSRKINKVDEKQIRDIVKEVLNIDNLTNIERMGGLTNRTFRVEGENTDSYVVRLPGEGTEEIINRSDEKISTELAGNVGIDAKLFYFGENTGIKVSEYITDSRTMHPQDMQKLENLVLAAEVLKKLHNSGIDTGVSFDVIDMAETYEKYIIENGGFFYEDYEEIKACINQIKANYLPTVTKNLVTTIRYVKTGFYKMIIKFI